MLPSQIPSSSQAIDNNRYSQIHLVPCCLAAKAKTDPTQKVRTIVLSIEIEVMYLFHTDTMFCNVWIYCNTAFICNFLKDPFGINLLLSLGPTPKSQEVSCLTPVVVFIGALDL